MGSRRQRQVRDHRRRPRPVARPRPKGPCIYCKGTTNDFTTREHPFAESVVGQNSKILQRGAVCDRCNHEVNNLLDEALAEFSPIAMMRVDLGITGKSGKPAKAKFQNASRTIDARRLMGRIEGIEEAVGQASRRDKLLDQKEEGNCDRQSLRWR